LKDHASRLETFLNGLAGARVVILFLFHALVFTAAYAFSYLLRFEFAIPAEWAATFRYGLILVVGIQLLTGVIFGFYQGWWRYVGLADVVRLVFGLTTATAVLVALWYVGPLMSIPERYVHTPRGILLIDCAFSLLALFGARVLIRLGRDHMRGGTPAEHAVKRVIIVGAGDAGEMLAREIEHRPQLGMKVVAFVDDQRRKWNSQIRGIRVTGPISDIADIADAVAADEALIAIPSASGKRLREIIQFLADANLQFKTMPGMDQLVSGKVQVAQLRPVNLEDLLRRRRVDLPGDPVRDLFRGKRVLVTGAGGTIGSELAAQILRFEPEVLSLVDRSEFGLYEVRKRLSREAAWSRSAIRCNLVDIGDDRATETVIARDRPQIVLHAAAHKHVPLGEENPAEYVRNNALATRRLAERCSTAGVERFVLVSTDKAINPTSVMGASKRVAEILLLDLGAQSAMVVTIVRFGNVIGSSGSVVPLFLEQIAAGGPVTVTHPDVTRYFIRTSEAISLVLQAATLGDPGRVFMLDMGEPLKILDLARDMIRLSNHAEDEIPIAFTGLRPGEKLFEEIRLHGESIHPTVHPQIVVTEAPQPWPHAVAKWIEAFNDSDPTPDRVRALLRDLVPEYAPSGSSAETPVAPPLDAKIPPAARTDAR
jgi:FlaA1/EpsC-like NDP-sugar epimerase